MTNLQKGCACRECAPTKDPLFQARDVLLKLLEARGDFRAESPVRGESVLALAAIDASHREVLSDGERIAMLQAAHRALFHAGVK